MNVAEWEDWFRDQFPNGVKAIRIEDVEEEVGLDRQSEDLGGVVFCPYIRVVGIEEEDEPIVRLFSWGSDTHVFVFHVASVEKRPKGFLLKTPEGDRDWLFSTNFSDDVGKNMRAERLRYEAQVKKYGPMITDDEED